MKKTITIFGTVLMLTAICLVPAFSFAQAPQAFKYQTIVRDNTGNILASHMVSFRISILQGSSTGASVFTETQTAATNQFGLANLSIGLGTLVSGNFSTISWGTNNYFVKIDFDPAGGTDFNFMGTSQLLSVPFALYAQNTNAWSLTGNAGTVDGTNFMGTTDQEPFNIKVNNQKAGRIDFQQNAANTFFGFQAGNSNNSGSKNTAIGYGSLDLNTSGNFNTAAGYSALLNNSTGNANTAFGNSAGYNSIGSGNVFFGYNAGYGETGSNKLYIDNGFNSAVPLIKGDFSAGFVGINTGSPSASIEVHGASGATIKIIDGNQAAGKVLTSDGAGQGSWQTPSGGSTGGWTLTGNAITDSTNFIGTTTNMPFNIRVANQKAGRIDFDANFANTFFGFQAGIANNGLGKFNTANGYQALYTNTSGYYNTANGHQSLYSNTMGYSNTAIGAGALWHNTTGTANIGIGIDAGFANTTGSGNVFLGNDAGSNETGSNTLYIANSGTNPPLIYGDFSAKFIGINTITPLANLEVDGASGSTIKIVDGNQAAGKVLTSDGTGQGSWQTPNGANAWGLLGNASTIDGTNFIGTTDNIPFNIRVGNQKAGRIEFDPATANTFFGFKSGNAITSGGGNTSSGYQSLSHNTTGNYNSATGLDALGANISGNSNTANGYQALEYNVAGNNATAIGYNAMQYANNTSSPFDNYNVALGFEALRGSSAAANNVGNANTALGYQSLWSNTTGSYNTGSGTGALHANTTGSSNTATGVSALHDNTTGSDNTALGTNALPSNTTGVQNTATGSGALYGNVSGGSNTATGFQALNGNTTGNQNSAHGMDALTFNTTGNDNTANGAYALYLNTTGAYNTANGANALYANITGGGNTAIGVSALQTNTIGNDNTAIGTNALPNSTGNQNTATGSGALYANTSGLSNTANGMQALASNMTGIQNTAQGADALYSNVAGSNATAIGYNAMYYANNTATPFENHNVALGFEALRGSATAANNTGNGNTAIGYQSLWTNTGGNYNTSTGTYALTSNTTGGDNTSNGTYALTSNTTGSANTSIGRGTLYSNIAGDANTAIGDGALGINISGSHNTALGTSAGLNTTGSDNVFLGYQAGSNETGSNKLYIANSSANPPLIYGDFSTANVGIGTITPAAKLEVDGASGTTIRIVDGNQAAGKVLTSSATGQASWQTPSGGTLTSITAGTGLTGSTITTSGTIGLSVPVSIANGGTNITTVGAAGSVIYSNGTQHSSTAIGTAGQVLTSSGAGTPTWTTPSTGAVTSFSSGNLSPLFTTSVGTSTTTPALSFAISNAAAYTILGDNTNAAAAPTFFTPVLASALFQNQGTTSTLLHGNAAGNPSWGPIVNADITNGTIDLTTKVTGILSIANGGTNTSTIGAAGSVIYSNGTQHASTAVGTSGQVLTSSGTGAPTWTTPSGGSGGWAITGNIGTIASTAAYGTPANNNYIGSTDAKDFVLVSNNLERMRITSAGNVGIGTATPASLFSVGDLSQFQINLAGNIAKVNNITTIFPSAQATAPNQVLTNNGAGVLSWAAAASPVALASGTYTPTFPNTVNVSASTAFLCTYMRVGNTVTVSGRIDIQPSVNSLDTQLGISLPVASAFTTTEQLGGTAYAPGGSSQGGALLSNPAVANAMLRFKSVSTSFFTMYFTFTYQVI